MTLWTLHTAYDAEARVRYTIKCDVPGLLIEGETLERSWDRAVVVLPELEDNAAFIPAECRQGPHELRLAAFHESTDPVLA